MELKDETKNFLLKNKNLIKANDFYNLFYDLINTSSLTRTEVTNLLKELGVDLKDYINYSKEDEVKIISTRYIYENASEYFDIHNIPKALKLKYNKNNKYHLRIGDKAKILLVDLPYLIIEEEMSGKHDVYLVYYESIKRI